MSKVVSEVGRRLITLPPGFLYLGTKRARCLLARGTISTHREAQWYHELVLMRNPL